MPSTPLGKRSTWDQSSHRPHATPSPKPGIRHGLACLVGAFFTALSVPAQAGWVLAKTVKNVRTIGETGGVTFMTVEPVVNPGNCSATDFYGINPTDAPKNHLAVLLSAQLSGLKISLFIPDATPCDAYGRPRVTHVLIGDF